MLLLGFLGSSAGKESACTAGDSSSIPGLGSSPGEAISYPLQYSWASLVAQMVKNLTSMWETWVRSLGWEDSLEEDNSLQYSCLENPHGQRSLAGYGPWGHKESDTTEHLNTAQRSMLLLDVHRTFRKTHKKINIIKFQKVEFFFCVCDLVIHTRNKCVFSYTRILSFEIIFHYRLLQDIDYMSLCYLVNVVACCIYFFKIRNVVFYSYKVKQVESKCQNFFG